MQFNIIDIPADELNSLSVAQMKLLRAAQRKKDELEHNAELQLEEFRMKVLAAGMKNSTLFEDMKKAVSDETQYICTKIADNLIYEMSVCKSDEGSDGDDGGGSSGGGSYETGYLVDYSLSYSERYVIVRDYYLTFTDVEERMAKYSADEVAKKYLDSYYKILYNVLATYEK